MGDAKRRKEKDPNYGAVREIRNPQGIQDQVVMLVQESLSQSVVPPENRAAWVKEKLSCYLEKDQRAIAKLWAMDYCGVLLTVITAEDVSITPDNLIKLLDSGKVLHEALEPWTNDDPGVAEGLQIYLGAVQEITDILSDPEIDSDCKIQIALG